MKICKVKDCKPSRKAARRLGSAYVKALKAGKLWAKVSSKADGSWKPELYIEL